MASFKNIIQTIFAVFISLWTVVARFFTSFVTVFRLRSTTPVLPVTVQRCQTTYTSFGDLTGSLDQVNLHRPQKVATAYPPSPYFLYSRQTTANIQPSRLTTNTNMIYHQQAPFALVRETLPKDPIFLTPFPSLGSASDISVRSNSPGPKTPSPPPSPVIAVQVVPQDDDCNYDSMDIIDGGRYFLDIKKDSPLQVITASAVSTAVSKYDNDTSQTDSDISIDMPMVLSDESTSSSLSYFTDNDTFDVDPICDILPNSFRSHSSSMSSVFESISELQGLDWPLPPGPVFRFQDEISAVADIAEAFMQRRLESPIPPLRIVKRNTTPPPRNAFDDASFPISDTSEYSTQPSAVEIEMESGNCSTDSHPFLDISAPHLFSEDIITAAHARSERSHKLTNILSKLPNDELVNVSNLPTGTVVSIEKTDGYKLKYPETKTADNAKTIPVSANSTASTPSTSSSSTAPCTPLISTKHHAPFFQRTEEKFPSAFDEFALLLLEAEYDRWMAGFADPDPHLGFMEENEP